MCVLSSAEVVKTTNEIMVEAYFPALVYTLQKPEFLANVKQVCLDALETRKKVQSQLDELYPAYMTDNLFNDVRITDFAKFVAETAWNILEGQGHFTQGMTTVFQELWCQEHYKHSAMDEHIHGRGAQLVGFYFIDTPENCSRPVLHDPRSGKTQINLPEADMSKVTPASDKVNFQPKPGMLIFTNSWLPHSFSRHGSDEPLRFIHFTIGVQYAEPQQACPAPTAEVI
jgi:uncharacterized protein (TIGR02466 family)